jgi:poly-gamma-glutamate capsule biosynthesis protein CapA/YwtB (metallophosphatase superfamily)
MKADVSTRISFVGDIAFNGRYEMLLREGKTWRLERKIKLLTTGSDLTIGNLEGPLTTANSVGPPWRFSLRGSPEYAPVLRAAGFDVVSLANNHAMDYGWEGLSETFRHLQSVGIKYVGAGVNIEEARKPLHVSVQGIQIAILAYCDVPTSSPLYAGDDCPGVAPMHRAFILEDVGKVRQKCDVLIVCMHWGQENISSPAPKYRQIGREMIAAGVNIIVGHHPHVLQGIERVGSGVVAYSLGNFTFSNEDWNGTNRLGEPFSIPYRLNEANRQSALWQVCIDGGEIAQEILTPVYLGNDLLPVADYRPERKMDFVNNNAALKTRPYNVIWSIRMIRSRLRVILVELHLEHTSGKQLLKLRPRHIRDLVKLLAREWELFRGTE